MVVVSTSNNFDKVDLHIRLPLIMDSSKPNEDDDSSVSLESNSRGSYDLDNISLSSDDGSPVGSPMSVHENEVDNDEVSNEASNSSNNSLNEINEGLLNVKLDEGLGTTDNPSLYESNTTNCHCPVHSGAYKLIKSIGRGASGEVFLSQDENSKQCAIKMIVVDNPSQVSGIFAQAQQCKELSHPHIVEYKEIFTHLDQHNVLHVAIVMPFYKLGDAAHLVNKHKMSESRLLHIGIQVASALAYLHSRQPPMVHRDLKLENLLYDGENVFLSDLETGIFLGNNYVGYSGTYPYQPPETLETNVYGTESDIWSLGCVLYVLATRPQFPPVMHLESMNPNYKCTIRNNLRSYSEQTTSVILNMLQVDPTQRPTAKDVEHILTTILIQIPNHQCIIC